MIENLKLPYPHHGNKKKLKKDLTIGLSSLFCFLNCFLKST